VASANAPDTDFPLQNLPFGVFRRDNEPARGGIAIGDQVLDLSAASAAGLFSGLAAEAAALGAGPVLNPLLAAGQGAASALRAAVFDLLADGAPSRAEVAQRLVPMQQAEMLLPVAVGGFTDFLCSYDHTKRMGGGNLPPAFMHFPIAYNSRASSVRVSGQPVRRPNGQFRAADGAVAFGPEPMLDYELELGAYCGPGNPLGEPLSVADAAGRLFGYCLLNDWSARGIQFLESLPLGPFLGKSLSTTISPWIVTT
jgi:fumarylacetoacetase